MLYKKIVIAGLLLSINSITICDNILFYKINEFMQFIKSFNDKNELRDFFALNKGIKGLAYKEASHFLRNIGFKGYAILDKHIINSLHEFGVLKTNDKPKNAKEYLEIEQKFIDFSKDVGIGVDELDLLLWS